MDAVEFLKEYKRLCRANTNGENFGQLCKSDCPIYKICKASSTPCGNAVLNNIDEAVKIIEKWSKEHPKKTRLQDLLEKYPLAKIYDEKGEYRFCCADLGYCQCKYLGDGCDKCWSEPVE